MDWFQAIVLGLVQGLTEFLPVSSSGHLVLAQEFLGVEDKGVTFEILVHFATLLSVLIYFWKILWKMLLSIIPPFKPELARERKMILLLFIASIPAGIVGFSPMRKFFERAYEQPSTVALLLLVTGSILFLPRLISRYRKKKADEDVTPKTAIAMGIGQAFAILPGISRSGSTIVSGMVAGVNSSAAAEFSFLMAIPAIAAASVVELKDIGQMEAGLLGPYIAGGVFAFLSGLVAIFAVLESIRKGKFEYFGIYCFIAGIAAFSYFKFFGEAKPAPEVVPAKIQANG